MDKVALIYIVDRKLLVAQNKGRIKWYLPGGQREPNETDIEVLCRETKEELSTDLDMDSISHYKTVEAQADGQEEGVKVRVISYMAAPIGNINASSEIAAIRYIDFSYIKETSAPTQMIMSQLQKDNLID